MSNVQLIAAAIGIAISGFIFYLVRKDRLVTKDGLIWLCLSAFILLFSLSTQLIDLIGQKVGVAYPPILLVLLGIGVILIKLVLNDVEKTQLKADVERLLQHNALLEAEIAALRHHCTALSAPPQRMAGNAD